MKTKSGVRKSEDHQCGEGSLGEPGAVEPGLAAPRVAG